MKQFINNLICLIIGHKESDSYFESDTIIASHGCKRCGAAWGNWYWKGGPPPPHKKDDCRTKEEQDKDWNIFLENQYEHYRKKVSNNKL